MTSAIVWTIAFAALGGVFALVLWRSVKPERSATQAGDTIRRASATRLAAIAVVTGAGLFALTAIRFGSDWRTFVLGPFTVVALVAAVIDAEDRLIPNRLVFPSFLAFGVALVVIAVSVGGPDLATAGIGLLLFGGALLLVALAVPTGMGMGDVKFAALIGLVLGSVGLTSVALAALISCVVGAIGGVVVFMAERDRKATLPFGPSLATGAIVAVLVGQRLIAAWSGAT